MTNHLQETLAWTVFPTARFLRNSRDWKANGSSPSLLRRGAEMKAREKTRSSEGLLVLVRTRVSPLSTDLTLAKKAMMETSQWQWWMIEQLFEKRFDLREWTSNEVAQTQNSNSIAAPETLIG